MILPDLFHYYKRSKFVISNCHFDEDVNNLIEICAL